MARTSPMHRQLAATHTRTAAFLQSALTHLHTAHRAAEDLTGIDQSARSAVAPRRTVNTSLSLTRRALREATDQLRADAASLTAQARG
ncbi:hypothetical protein, partial [Peterkaempfera griseoplana]|uniref:hypothetical protein n=1 Tax=Peterkaempfera griseoplana TaxID=66896 RepID=UPI0012FF50C9